jgi:hypothetical protein
MQCGKWMSNPQQTKSSQLSAKPFEFGAAQSQDRKQLSTDALRSIRSIRDEWEVRAASDATWAGLVDFTEQAPAAQAHTGQKLHNASSNEVESSDSLPLQLAPVSTSVRTACTTFERQAQASNVPDKADNTACDPGKSRRSNRHGSHAHNLTDMPDSPAPPNVRKGRAAEAVSTTPEKSMRIGSKIGKSAPAKLPESPSSPNNPSRKPAGSSGPTRVAGIPGSKVTPVGAAAAASGKTATTNAAAGGFDGEISLLVRTATSFTDTEAQPLQQASRSPEVASDSVSRGPAKQDPLSRVLFMDKSNLALESVPCFVA